jgi:hypothetical protein
MPLLLELLSFTTDVVGFLMTVERGEKRTGINPHAGKNAQRRLLRPT